jgi:hypothetical protein
MRFIATHVGIRIIQFALYVTYCFMGGRREWKRMARGPI